MNFFDHKDLGNHLLQLCPKVVKHPVYIYMIPYLAPTFFGWSSSPPNTSKLITIN